MRVGRSGARCPPTGDRPAAPGDAAAAGLRRRTPFAAGRTGSSPGTTGEEGWGAGAGGVLPQSDGTGGYTISGAGEAGAGEGGAGAGSGSREGDGERVWGGVAASSRGASSGVRAPSASRRAS